MQSVHLLPVIHLPTPGLQFAIVAIVTPTKVTTDITVCFIPVDHIIEGAMQGQRSFFSYLSNTLHRLKKKTYGSRGVQYLLAIFFFCLKKSKLITYPAHLHGCSVLAVIFLGLSLQNSSPMLAERRMRMCEKKEKKTEKNKTLQSTTLNSQVLISST